MLEWNVFVNDINHKEIKTFNVFDHWRFFEYCVNNAYKNSKDFVAFSDQLEKDVMYCYWSKCEWEVIISDWPPTGECESKVDVYDQILMNWDHFCRYVWEHGVELRRWKRNQKMKAEEYTKLIEQAEANNGNSYS